MDDKKTNETNKVSKLNVKENYMHLESSDPPLLTLLPQGGEQYAI